MKAEEWDLCAYCWAPLEAAALKKSGRYYCDELCAAGKVPTPDNDPAEAEQEALF